MNRLCTPAAVASHPLAAWFNDPFFNFDLPVLKRTASNLRLATDFYEDDDHFYARVELPGAKKEEIKVELEKDLLGIRYERESDDDETVSYRRDLQVPDGIEADKINAKLEDGILTITLPKGEAAKPHEIVVS